MAEVVLKGITKRFGGGVVAVDNVSLHVNDKELLVLVGPSGCGKTTVLRIIAGLEQLTEGDVYVGDRLVNDMTPKDRDIAMVFQNYALYPHMTVYDNMAFGLRLRKFSKEEIEKRVRDAAEILEIAPLLSRKPKELSGGQRQRVAVGRAIVRHPLVFLFDEPLSNLDARLRVQMRAEIVKLHARLGVTMIYVTHDQTEAMTMGQRIVVMHKGIVRQVDEPLEVYRKPADAFVAGFIGTPSMNLIKGRAEETNGKLVFKSASVSVELPQELGYLREACPHGEILLGARPEDVAMVESPEAGSIELARGSVELVEALGSEGVVHVSVGKAVLVSKAPGESLPVRGDAVTLSVPLSRIHLFDAKSEARLVRPTG
ncbi:MAG: sn-glycerol-3-phosphate ABC transporter ATP-binding protein UgpC [Candidatus Eiseniibacteriota bacterium]|nr:MAG: sn-glycerol-3-phosphate ABC transporter ATP-binding protein UgpC [Candidatus Eisenbacteria bacterium]